MHEKHKKHEKLRGSGHWLWLSLMVIMLDQLTKWAAVNYLSLGKPVVLTSFFNLTLDYNTGAAFSFLKNQSGWQIGFFSSIALIVSIFFTVWLVRIPAKNRLFSAGLALIIGGAMGNLIDRVWHRYVIDFVQWHISHYYWPTFNIADSAVCIGALFVILRAERDRK